MTTNARELIQAEVRRERRRAAIDLGEDAAVAAALGRVGRELLMSLDSPTLMDSLCRVATEALGCDSSYTLLWQLDEKVFRVVAGYGGTPEEQEIARIVAVPQRMTVGLLSQLEHDEVAEVHTTDESIPTTPQRRKSTQLCIALRRGRDVIGLQTASRRGCGESFGNREHRIARGMAQPASLIVEHARVREELEWHSRLKSEFVATMSHELRTPLNVALGYLDLVLDGEFGCLTTDQDRVLQCARKSARKLVSLVDSTLDLSRLEKGMAELEVRSFRLADIADEIRDEMRDECSRPGLVVTFDIPRELSLCTDNVKLKVVVRNIVDNALKFTRSGSVKVSATKREGGTVISVTDTGVGISAEVLRIIFEPFRQGDSSTTRRFDGVGLGLYVVRRLLDVLGGTISVESEVEHGTTFRISVPDLLPPEAKSPTVRCGQA